MLLTSNSKYKDSGYLIHAFLATIIFYLSLEDG